MPENWPPGPPPPAPLDLVQDLLSTWYGHLDGGADELLDSPAALARWCSQHGVNVDAADVKPRHLDRARAVREGLRAVLARHNDASLPHDAAAIAALSELSDRLTVRVSLLPDLDLVPAADGVDRCLTRVLAAPLLVPRRDWERLKVCREPNCRTAFYDASRNGSRTWCSMAACGAASKQRAFIDRRRERRSTPAPA
jgi:predicted RNA-binding Zn ribbon-like protein